MNSIKNMKINMCFIYFNNNFYLYLYLFLIINTIKYKYI